eukprot:1136233-Pelagomonas_calceolata.AAC.3
MVALGPGRPWSRHVDSYVYAASIGLLHSLRSSSNCSSSSSSSSSRHAGCMASWNYQVLEYLFRSSMDVHLGLCVQVDILYPY